MKLPYSSSAADIVVEGGLIPPIFNPDLIAGTPWGSITITFFERKTGLMEWTTTNLNNQLGSMLLVPIVGAWNQ